ncbi:MAG: hypothetical protein ACP5QY_11675, partial [Candidatus Hydrogenedens sp.]
MKRKIYFLITIMCLILFLFLLTHSTLAEVKSLKNYYCPKCGTHIESVNQPMMGSYNAGGGHSWRCLGEVGDRNYQCSKCGLLIRSKDS